VNHKTNGINPSTPGLSLPQCMATINSVRRKITKRARNVRRQGQCSRISDLGADWPSAASMPFFPGETGHHEQRLPAGKTPKLVQRPWDHTLTGPEQPPCHVFQEKQATMNSACRPGEPPDKSRETGSQLHFRFFSLRGSRALSRARNRTVLSETVQSRVENRALMCRCACNSTSITISELQVSQSPNMSFPVAVTPQVTELLHSGKASHVKWHPLDYLY